MTLDDVCAIFSDELGRASINAEPAEVRVSWADAERVTSCFQLFRPIDVEVALGDQFDRVRGSRWRTIPIIIFLPRYIVDALRQIPLVAGSESLTSRAERLVCEHVEVDLELRSARRSRPDQS